jgi:hypothetical protein
MRMVKLCRCVHSRTPKVFRGVSSRDMLAGSRKRVLRVEERRRLSSRKIPGDSVTDWIGPDQVFLNLPIQVKLTAFPSVAASADLMTLI